MENNERAQVYRYNIFDFQKLDEGEVESSKPKSNTARFLCVLSLQSTYEDRFCLFDRLCFMYSEV